MSNNSMLLGVTLLALFPLWAQAGELDSFEEEATRERTKHDKRHGHQSRRDDDSHEVDDCRYHDNGCRTSHLILDLTGSLVEGMISSGLSFSALRMDPVTDSGRPNPYLREIGEPMLPAVRFDLHHQTTDSGLYANDLRVEFGHGPLALQGRFTRFVEPLAQDSLDYSQLHALLRLSYTEGLGLNLGAGVATLDGNEHTTGSSFTMPVFLHLTPNLGFEFRPTMSWFNGNMVSESDSVFMLRHKAASLSFGYRSLETSSQQISGPYMGLSLRY